jgi:2-keto-3-deoxy-6-phosphogluconate aldolase
VVVVVVVMVGGVAVVAAVAEVVEVIVCEPRHGIQLSICKRWARTGRAAAARSRLATTRSFQQGNRGN